MNQFEHQKWTEPERQLTPEEQAENRKKLDDPVSAERERCIKLVCFDCRNYPERRIVFRPGKGWMHQLIGGEYLCRATGIREAQ
jgi:hypothetical protein